MLSINTCSSGLRVHFEREEVGSGSRGASLHSAHLTSQQGAILTEFPRLALKDGLKECLCNIARRKPESTFDNIVRDFGVRYVEGYTSPNFADVVANAPFSE
jgi:hypothetical protein